MTPEDRENLHTLLLQVDENADRYLRTLETDEAKAAYLRAFSLDRTLHELKRLANGIEEEELARVKAGLKSALIMRQESTSARAGSNSSDWFLLGRVRPLAEIQAAVDALTPAKIIEHLRRFPAKDFTIVTLGPESLRVGE